MINKLQAIDIKSILTNQLIQIIMGFTIMFLSSQLYIDIKPVPISMQTVGVMLVGLTFSPKVALYSLLAWFAAGSIGVPVFFKFSTGIVRASTGYLIGFIIAAPVMSYLKSKLLNNSFISLAINCTIGSFIIYLLGISWLTYIFNFSRAIEFGLLPFIVPGILKIFILSASIKAIKIKG